jgi:hypothetical protein
MENCSATRPMLYSKSLIPRRSTSNYFLSNLTPLLLIIGTCLGTQPIRPGSQSPRVGHRLDRQALVVSPPYPFPFPPNNTHDPLRSNYSDPNFSSTSKSPRHAPFGLSLGRGGRLSEESEDEDEDKEAVDAVRSRMMTACSSTQDIDFLFSIESLGPLDARGRGDSLSTNLSATTASSSSLRTCTTLRCPSFHK